MHTSKKLSSDLGLIILIGALYFKLFSKNIHIFAKIVANIGAFKYR